MVGGVAVRLVLLPLLPLVNFHDPFTYLLVRPARTAPCPACLASRSDGMFVRILRVRDFLLRLGSRVCVAAVFPIIWSREREEKIRRTEKKLI